MDTTPDTPATEQPSRTVIIIANTLMVLFSLIVTVLAVEAFMRVGLDALPDDIQGEIGHVQRVPWDDGPIIPPVPFESSRSYQSHIPPGLTDQPVRWRDARFSFDTRNLWDHPVGLRVDEPTYPLDIIAFGDSFTFCWTEAEDCWVQMLQSEHGWNTLNAGTPGNGPGGQLNVIREVGIPLEPQVIVWQRYDNDLLDDYVLATLRGEVEGLRLPPGPDPVRLPRGLAQYSAILHLLDNRIDPPEQQTDFAHGQIVPINGADFIIATDEYPPANNTAAYPSVEYGWEQNLAHYQEGVDLVEAELGAPVVIVMIPYKELVYAEQIGDALPADYLDQMRANRADMRAECEARGWYCLDALPALQAAAAETDELVYYAGDFHLAPYGNAVLAQAINDYLVEQGVLTGPG